MGAIDQQAVKLMAEEIIRAVKTITEKNNIAYVNNQINNFKVSSQNISADFYARVADIAVLEAQSATIDTAQIENLYATVADFIYLAAANAAVGDLTAQKITSAVADISNANIGSADIGWAQIKDLVTDTAIIREGIGGKLFIDQLAVSDANMVSLTTGQLIVKGDDGKFYALSVDGSGNVTTTLKQVTGTDIAENAVSGSNIIENAITARELNVSSIFADNALIGAIKSANIDTVDLLASNAFINAIKAVNINVDDLFADSTFTNSLSTNIISSPTIGSGIDISGNSSITLANDKIGLVVSNDSTSTSLVLADGFLDVVAENIDLSANETITAAVNTATTSLSARIDANESSIALKASQEDVNGIDGRLETAESKLTPTALETTIQNSDALSAVSQKADKIDFVVSGGTSSSNVTLTDGALNAISQGINLSAEKINAVADEIDLSGNTTITSVNAGSSVIINEDGMTLNGVRIDMNVTGEDGETSALRIDNNGVVAEELATPNDIGGIPYAAKRYGNDELSYTITTFADIANLLNNRLLDRNITITCDTSNGVEWSDAPVFRGVTGSGSITIHGGGVQLAGAFSVIDCYCRIAIDHLYANYVQTRSPYVVLSDCEISTSVTSTVTESFPATLCKTFRTAGRTFYGDGSYFYQGSSGSYAEMLGHMWFGSASVLLGKTIRSAQLTLRRVSGIGSGVSVLVTAYTSTKTAPVEYGYVDESALVGDLGKIANGEQKTFDLAVSAISAIAQGYSLVLFTNEGKVSSISGRYAKFYGSGDYVPTLTVTYDSTTVVQGNTRTVDDGGLGTYLTAAGFSGGGGGGGSYTLPVASSTIMGGIKVGSNLSIDMNGVLSVTVSDVVEDNTKPITSAAVNTQIGNIEALLAAL